MKQKIPTLLALIVLIAIIGLSIFFFLFKKNNELQTINTINPQEITIANLADTSVSVIWQTEAPSKGRVILNNTKYDDDRKAQDFERKTHYVTISNLTPNTNYEFQLEINGLIYPENPLKFKTISHELSEKATNEQTYQPIRGTINTEKQQPVDEAIVVLKFPNAVPKATFVTSDGNFVLPLTRLINTDLTDTIKLTEKQPTILEARKGMLVSLVQISIPLKDQILNPITLGKNENMIDFLSQPAGTPQPLEFQSQKMSFDLNNDGKINTLDSSLISDLITRKQYNPAADFNNDQTIDNKDLDLIKDKLE